MPAFRPRTCSAQSTQSSHPASPWFPFENALLKFIEKDFYGYKHEQMLIKDIHAIALDAFVAISNCMDTQEIGATSSKVVAISSQAIASIQETAQRREARALELQSLL